MFESKCCPECRAYFGCESNAKAEMFCDIVFSNEYVLALFTSNWEPVKKLCEECPAYNKPCFKEKEKK